MVTLNKLFPKHGSRKAKRRLGIGLILSCHKSTTSKESNLKRNTDKEIKPCQPTRLLSRKTCL